MAEIRIEKKPTPIWPWILGLLLLGAAALFFFMDDNDEERLSEAKAPIEKEEVKKEIPDIYKQQAKGMEATAAEYKAAVPLQLAKFAAYIDTPDEKMNLEHDYSCKALELLAKSLAAVTDAYDIDNVEMQDAKNLMLKKADILDNDPLDTKHADYLQEAFTAASDVMKNIQMRHLPEMKDEVKSICDQAVAISANKLTLHQKDTVKDYFQNAANTLEKIALALEAKSLKENDSM